MKPLFKFPDDKMEAEKQDWKQKLFEYKEILKAKKSGAVTEAQKAYKVFRCVVLAIRKLSGTRLSTKCISRTRGLA